MILVADSSALIVLAACDALVLLEKLFGRVVVPEAVFHEIDRAGKGQAERLREFLLEKVVPVNPDHPVLLDGYCDPGEAEAMLLYHQLSADRLLIDDRRGRRMAKINRISVIGSMGTLIAAKRSGFIREVKPRIDAIVDAGIHISPALVAMVLESAGE
jgi:predicted nucleic acid-binding protein